jgi:hypothetical protein
MAGYNWQQIDNITKGNRQKNGLIYEGQTGKNALQSDGNQS